MSAPAPRVPLGVGLCLWGFVVAKAAAFGLLTGGGLRAVHFPALIGAWWGDALVAGSLLVASMLCAKSPGRVGRIAAGSLTVVGGGFATYSVANVYLVAAYGSPLTVAMLSYGSDANPTALWAPIPLASAALAGIVFLVGARPAARACARCAPQRTLMVLAALGVVGGLVHALDKDGAVRALGLDRNAVSLLVISALPLEGTSDDVDGPPSPDEERPSLTLTQRWPAPSDARFTAPVAVDTSRGRPRHVVLWLAESVGTRHISVDGALGGPSGSASGSTARDTTPRLRELSAHSVQFAQYAANSPISAKAIFTTLCGYHPLPEPAFEARAVPRIACPSLMETLTSKGWDAALFHGGYFAFTDKRSLLEERGFSLLVDGESMPERERWFTNGWGIDDAALVERGLAWLDTRPEASRPSLSVYIPLVPHYEYFLPPSAPRPFGEETLLDRYHNGVHYTDALFGRLVDAYAERGLLEDTLFVFVGDHGEAFEEHPRNKLHAGFLYEENVRAPLVLISPRLFPQRQISERLGSHVDLTPTVLSLLGVPLPTSLQGQSLVDDAYAYRPTILGTWYPDPLLGLRDGDMKYVVNLRSGVEQIFDLARDPQETTNLAAMQPERAHLWGDFLRRWQREQTRFLRSHPARGSGYLDRIIGALEVTLIDESGAELQCTRSDRRADRIQCGEHLWVGLAQDRVFNMERRCLRVSAPSAGSLRLRTRIAPAPTTVGLGLTDRARMARGAPVSATFSVAGSEAVTLTVDDRFESSSRVTVLQGRDTQDETAPYETAPEGPARVEITVAHAVGANRSACITLAP